MPGIGGGVDLAVSHTADPSGDWDLWRLPFDGGCADYDTLGYSSDKVAVSATILPQAIVLVFWEPSIIL